ncbi:uncharacterized protein LOC135843654 [Planococcus citri]|uniref:uncharacterized protein LOC135843654 n=1 Tax=Planococcus citri TaxID=170843 RepID=UPI0031F8A7F4
MFDKSRLLLCLIYLCIIKSAESIKLLRIVVPPYKLRGDQAILECHYELEGDSLYAVKWYKDNEEFFRYVPKSQPPLFSYKLDGIKVDHENSDSNHVTLKSVNLRTSGTYRCEVSAEAPFFSSAQKEGRMEVVFLPRNGPQITGERTEYQIGDELNLNCTSGKSYPPSLLRWYVNEKPVKDKDLIHYTAHTFAHGLAASILGLRLTILSDHFVDDGSMKVRCVATVAPLLWQGDRESVLQKIDKREALLLVKSSKAVANRLDRTIILPILSYVLCLTMAL